MPHGIVAEQAAAAAIGQNDFGAADQTVWPYSEQYSTLASEGHRHPPPEFGTPTLIWHMGLWPKIMPGDSQTAQIHRESLSASHSAEERRWKEAELFDRDNKAFFAEVNAFLKRLQKKGRIEGPVPNELNFAAVEPLPGTKPGTVYSFAFGRPQAVAFTLWWRDSSASQDRQHQPSSADLRVRVHAQAALDHAIISIYVDAGKPWGEGYLVRGTPSFAGVRRNRIVQHVQTIRDLTEAQVSSGYVDLDVLPEQGVDAGTAERLSAAADYLYKGIWDEFIESFDLKLWPDKVKGAEAPIGQRFCESRGVLISIPGADTAAEEARQKHTESVRTRTVKKDGVQKPPSEGTIGIGTFPRFDAAAGEPNTIVKSLLPFLRRAHYRLDQREIVACGILDWRALFLTTMGSTANADLREESSGPDWEVPGGWLPDQEKLREAGTQNRPTRHLFVTKGEPHRMQIGRFVERVNAAECSRLFALKNWATMQNAGVHIRVLGRELDGILSEWSQSRLRIDSENRKRIKEIASIQDKAEHDRKKDESSGTHVEALYELINTTESRLISLAAALDSIGNDGAGRLVFALTRSHHFVKEFERLIEMIDIGDIPTWLNYKNFVKRGMRSSFDVVEETHDRLIGLRQRIQTITDVVQTSALIIEAEATKQNTRELRLMARNYSALRTATYIAVAALAIQALALLIGEQAVSDWVKSLFGLPVK